MAEERITIDATDGACPAYVYTPKTERGPAIIFYFDAGGIRPAVRQMAQRLADAGYVVLLPDLFYRYGPYGPFDPVEVLAGDMAATLGPLIATTGNATSAEDTDAFLSYLSGRDEVTTAAVGTVGFCLGGGMAIAAGGKHPNRISAIASFHGGGLATEEPDSPHHYADKLKAELYIAAASGDPHCPPEMLKQFEAALSDADIAFTTETYPAAHGWMKPDFPVYDEISAERGWREMISFFDRTLKRQTS